MQEILFKQHGKLQGLFMLLPTAKLFQKLWMKVLKCLWLLGELLFEPLNG